MCQVATRSLVLLLALVACVGCGDPRDPQAPAETAARPAKEKPAEREPLGPSPLRAQQDRPAPYREIALDPARTGTLRGTCRLSAPYEAPPTPIGKCRENYDVDEVPSQRVLFDRETLGLANRMVRLLGVAEGKPWPAEWPAEARHSIRQRDGRFLPHVSVVRRGTQLVFSNDDKCLVNLHGYFESLLQTIFNFGMAPGVEDWVANEAHVGKPGKVILKCDCHPWLNGFVHVVAHPYVALTDESGAYEIAGIPAGTWTVEVWHEGMVETPVRQGTSITTYDYSPDHVEQVQIEVPAGGTTVRDFTIPAPAADD